MSISINAQIRAAQPINVYRLIGGVANEAELKAKLQAMMNELRTEAAAMLTERTPYLHGALRGSEFVGTNQYEITIRAEEYPAQSGDDAGKRYGFFQEFGWTDADNTYHRGRKFVGSTAKWAYEQLQRRTLAILSRYPGSTAVAKVTSVGVPNAASGAP